MASSRSDLETRSASNSRRRLKSISRSFSRCRNSSACSCLRSAILWSRRWISLFAAAVRSRSSRIWPSACFSCDTRMPYPSSFFCTRSSHFLSSSIFSLDCCNTRSCSLEIISVFSLSSRSLFLIIISHLRVTSSSLISMACIFCFGCEGACSSSISRSLWARSLVFSWMNRSKPSLAQLSSFSRSSFRWSNFWRASTFSSWINLIFSFTFFTSSSFSLAISM
mmetsp:Transcript_23593/g.54846  ORF Transcript_23593/g.54846 Transcript_23593/m.54846 type:complete len:223 (-) Transcript_23593:998-1666(-)